MILETDRLILREYVEEDFDALFEILSDTETMQHYPAPFDEDRTRNWINWNLDNYKKYGFGLWAVVLKETGEFIINLTNKELNKIEGLGWIRVMYAYPSMFNDELIDVFKNSKKLQDIVKEIEIKVK